MYLFFLQLNMHYISIFSVFNIVFLGINGCYCCKVGLNNNKVIDENRKITILDGVNGLLFKKVKK